MSLRRHFAAFILGVPVAELTADNLAEVDGMLAPDEQPAVDQRKVYPVVRGSELLECGPDQERALDYARRVGGVVAELPIVADYRGESPLDAVKQWLANGANAPALHWRYLGSDREQYSDVLPDYPIIVVHVEREPDGLIVVYRTAGTE